uniref:Uncharacterized protein n=1 Tax=Glossina brevipalpis TaxID=37001 RepID=A0A1A9W280_9MUSC
MDNQQQQQQHYATTATAAAQSVVTLPQPLNSSSEYANIPSSYMTIDMIPPPPPAVQSISVPGNSTTTFKTPLLPMPTLEDIEAATVSQPLIAGSIRKYPSTSATTATTVIPLSMPPPPLGIGPGPGPGLPGAQPPPPPPSTSGIGGMTSSLTPNATSAAVATGNLVSLTSTNIDATTCGTLKSMAKLQTPATLTATSNIAVGNNNCNTAATTSTSVSGNSSTSVPPPPPPSHTLVTSTASSSKNSSRSNLQHRPASPKCCACFGSGNNKQGRNSYNNNPANIHPTKSSGSSLSTKSNTAGNTTKKNRRRHRKHNSQTIWSAVLTNLGICALLLAYTLLGKCTS